jgi:GntR family transcriptional regulator of vanillate catabolism
MARSTDAADRGARTTNRVLLTLRTMLLAGEFRPGERLAELLLVSRLKASRTPVRLALDRLAHEGLLEPLATTGFRVSAFAIADIYDAIEIRGVLEGTAARLASERLRSDEELRQLRKAYVEAVDLLPMTRDRFLGYMELNEAFHSELWKLARSPMLLREIERHVALPFAAPGALVFSADRTAFQADAVIALEHHRAIIEAISQREASRAEWLAREHSYVARRALERALQSRELFRQMPGATLIATTDSAKVEKFGRKRRVEERR